ncbi:MAG: hypothetical protein LBJ10_08040 [Clostridiales bacterium]|jgi:hypothetical protein|nr:hypothetical protein [Clostridiales bacterium]
MDSKIYELYGILKIPKENWPSYENPYDFARQIERCALTENVFTTASNSSQTNSADGHKLGG